MTDSSMQTFGEWALGAHNARVGDPLWTVQAYRLSCYAMACLTFDRRANANLGKAPALDQLTRAVGSISANISEGYSRSSVADRTRFYGYALGSTREAIDWYDSLTIELGNVVNERQNILVQIRRLLLTMLRRARPDTPDRSMHDGPRRAPDADSCA
jgi:four helix bundle protein